ncbi:MAG: hypothetical protein Q4E65_08450 [Clostridia bacterium]|nr:hypothetical protein [Clostridia bacterium]
MTAYPIRTRTNGALDAYNDTQIENWQGSKKIIVYQDTIQFSRFVDDALVHKNAGKKLYFGKISNAFAKKILVATGINVKDFNCTIQAYEIGKIFKAHGSADAEAKQGQ